jgi:hypothetical protein
MKFSEYISEKINEDDYTASAEKNKLSKGFRALVLNKNGKTSYLSQVAYENEEDAISAAQKYIDTMARTSSTRALDDAMNDFERTHKIVESKGSAFENTFRIDYMDAIKISKNYGQKWEKNKDAWTMYDGGEHIMIYNNKKGELYTDFDVEDIKDMLGKRPMTESSFKFYDKVGLSKTLPKERGRYLVWDNEGKWDIQDKEQKDNCIKVDDVLDYYSWDYNLRTSIKVALTDIEKGKYETGEVQER